MNGFSVLVGYGFDHNGPYIELDWHIGRQIDRKKTYLKGSSFLIVASEERYCTGSFDLEALEGSPCADNIKIENSSNSSCYTCFDKTGFNPSFYHMAKTDISPQQRAYNNTAHAVYLAYFTEGLIKVGISSERRKEVRWVEQGARVVAHILTCENAYEARHNEELISKELKLPEVVLGKKKRSILTYEVNGDIARKSLGNLIDRIQEKLGLALHTDRIYTKDIVYNPESVKLSQNIIDLSDEKEKKISGSFLGLYGDILVVENDMKQFMYSLKKIVGLKIEFSDKEEKLDFQPQQITMF
tara:strand:+ start:3606 stop:4502 length:897 start_codon:yes stop_codon:yes gene_type:complete